MKVTFYHHHSLKLYKKTRNLSTPERHFRALFKYNLHGKVPPFRISDVRHAVELDSVNVDVEVRFSRLYVKRGLAFNTWPS